MRTPEEKRRSDRASSRRYYSRHLKKCLEYARSYRHKNRETVNARTRDWKKSNPGVSQEISWKWRRKNKTRTARLLRERRATDPSFKCLDNLRRRVYHVIKRGHKSSRTLALLGCTAPELRAHLETRFQPGMTWENYGPAWHVDHIRPCASFDLTDPAQQRACFHYANLQPLFALENLKKGSRYA